MSIREEYQAAFADTDAVFLTWHAVDSDPDLMPRNWTRGDIQDMAYAMAEALQDYGCCPEDRVALCMGGNQVYDVAIRYAAVLTGIVPVTVNWQADTFESIWHKIESCGVNIVVFDHLFDKELRKQIEASLNPDTCIECSEMITYKGNVDIHEVQADDTRIIIFTSGTTGQAKGVELPYRSYRCNQQTFESFLQIEPSDQFALCCVNPMHHTNSTAMTDWALRRAGTHLHLIERYSTVYWKTIADIARSSYDRVLAPTVSRHFDFLENLEAHKKLPYDFQYLKDALHAVEFLMGSAPVGPQTVERLQHFAGKIPLIRFGSTETCLQVMGTPVDLSEQEKQAILAAGWHHQWAGEEQCGYWIGRDHAPHTQVRAVKSISSDDENYMVDCEQGEPGFCITKGRHLMSRYVDNETATSEVFADGWYLGLGDIVFYLCDDNGAKDFYWQSRVSHLLIRGGSNYSCDYIANVVQEYMLAVFDLEREDYDLAVTGLRIHSEHEDECCVALDLHNEKSQSLRADLERDFLLRTQGHFSKGCAPDHLIFTQIPRNFKGALLMNDLRDIAREQLVLE